MVHQIRTQTFLWDRATGSFLGAPTNTDPAKTRFLKGPVPWSWIVQAANLPGAALQVGLCLWRLIGSTKKKTVALHNQELEPFGIDRYAKYRALNALESAGLVRIERGGKKAPLVTVIDRPGVSVAPNDQHVGRLQIQEHS